MLLTVQLYCQLHAGLSRYIFYINAPLIFMLSVSGFLAFPKEVRTDGRKPSLDFLGAGLGTRHLVLPPTWTCFIFLT